MTNKKDMNAEISIDSLIPFQQRTTQLYNGERLEQFKNSILEHGQLEPILVRPIQCNKYEIICGHNRVNAMKELKLRKVKAIVRRELSDEETLELFYDRNLNQQSFSDWNYTQKIEAVKYSEGLNTAFPL